MSASNNNEDLSRELAVTKNDIRHLDDELQEIKNGVNEVHSEIRSQNEQFYKTIIEQNEKLDEKYLRKSEFKEYKDNNDKIIKKVDKRNDLVVGSLITLLITVVCFLISGHIHLN